MTTPLQIMFYGVNLQNASVRCADRGVSVAAVHQAHSPNYLFVDVQIAPNAPEGSYTFEFTQDGQTLRHSYTMARRRMGSAQRRGFGTEDMIYLIIPDRFASGGSAAGAPPDAAERPDRANPYGRHGGNIEGIIGHLDYVRALGATAIWVMPLTFDNEPAASYHGYACADYYRIDPRFGDNDLYKKMTAEAHLRGIKVIKDVVPNHCGTAHWWMADLPFANWVNQFPAFTRSNYQMATQSDPYAAPSDLRLCTQGWFDYSMPDMNLANPFVVRYFTQMAVWWIEFADLDGLRVDTYPYSDKHGIAQWTQNVLAEYPNLNIVGETWFALPSYTAYWQSGSRIAGNYNSHLPSVMDFSLQENLIAGLLQDSSPQWGEGLMKVYGSLAQDFLYTNPNGIMIFADNHDTHRLAHLLRGSIAKQKMVMAILATMRGIPQLYYGSEVLLYNRERQGHGEERLDMPGGWAGDGRSVFTPEGRTKAESEMLGYVSRLFAWRKTAKAVHTGRTTQFLPVGNNLYVYFRYTDRECVMTIINNHLHPQTIDWERYADITEGYRAGTEVISGSPVAVGSPLEIPAQTAQVIHFIK